MTEDITTFIIRELSKPVDRRKIIQKVCKKGGLHWREAERLVILIEARHTRSIVARPTPKLLFLSIVVLALGIGLLAYNLQFVLALLQNEVLVQSAKPQGSQYIQLVSGAAMTAGGMIGLWKALGYIFPN